MSVSNYLRVTRRLFQFLFVPISEYIQLDRYLYLIEIGRRRESVKTKFVRAVRFS